MNFEHLQWNSTYETSVEEIDLQHQYLVKLINRVAEEWATVADGQYRERLILELTQYAAFHFVSEENLMMRLGYPDLKRHQKLHQQLLEHLTACTASPLGGNLPGTLVDWFVHHTTYEDIRIGEFVRLRRQSAKPG